MTWGQGGDSAREWRPATVEAMQGVKEGSQIPETGVVYAVGDVLALEGCELPIIVAHVCNDAGGWGRGFVVALSKRWPEPEAAYRRWANKGTLRRSMVQLVGVQEGVYVANMVAQAGYATRNRPVALDYGALEQCLGKLCVVANEMGASVRMPRIGCGLGGGDWGLVEQIIERTLVSGGVPVHVVDLL